MRILYFSDLHMEFPKMGSHLLPPLPDPSEYDVVVAAGDISYELQGVRWLDRFFPNDKPIIFVPGNHEYYTNDFDEVSAAFDSYEGRVQILDPGQIEIDGYTFLVATMWSDLKLKGYRDLDDWEVKRGIADFKWGFTPARMRNIHAKERLYIERRLAKQAAEGLSDKTVVVTHFVPTQLCVNPKWQGSPLNPYFTNDQDDLMERFKPAAWIFGHTHDRFDIIHPSGVHVVGNPHGYVRETPNFEWKILTV
jgi:Icc-related predicted phosphoesterase